MRWSSLRKKLLPGEEDGPQGLKPDTFLKPLRHDQGRALIQSPLAPGVCCKWDAGATVYGGFSTRWSSLRKTLLRGEDGGPQRLRPESFLKPLRHDQGRALLQSPLAPRVFCGRDVGV